MMAYDCYVAETKDELDAVNRWLIDIATRCRMDFARDYQVWDIPISRNDGKWFMMAVPERWVNIGGELIVAEFAEKFPCVIREQYQPNWVGDV